MVPGQTPGPLEGIHSLSKKYGLQMIIFQKSFNKNNVNLSKKYPNLK
jgi:hypothetical protein